MGAGGRKRLKSAFPFSALLLILAVGSLSLTGLVFRPPSITCNLSGFQLGPELPTEAFVITLPPRVEVTNYTAYALKNIQEISRVGGFGDNVQIVDGTYDGRYGRVAQIGLSLAHLDIWTRIVEQNITSAWVFEDDVIFHDDFNTLFPEYWKQVPVDYELVWVGHHGMWQHKEACEEPNTDTDYTFLYKPVYCTHAMVVSYSGALRLKMAMEGLLRMSQKANRTIFWEEIKIDIFINYIGEAFLVPADKHKWVIFDSTVKHPAKFMGVEWCRNPDMRNDKENFKNASCCEDCNVEVARSLVKQAIPVFGTGLAYQHFCKRNAWALERWRPQ